MDGEAGEADGRRTDTRERILDVASRLFRERGYSDTSLNEIAAELGVTKAALYYHFDSKVEILRALVEPTFAAVEEIVAREPDCSTPKARRAFVTELMVLFDVAGPVVASIAIDPRAAADIWETVTSSSVVERVAERLADGLVASGVADRAGATIRVAGALNAVQGMFDAWTRTSGGATSMDPETLDLMVAVVAAALEAKA